MRITLVTVANIPNVNHHIFTTYCCEDIVRQLNLKKIPIIDWEVKTDRHIIGKTTGNAFFDGKIISVDAKFKKKYVITDDCRFGQISEFSEYFAPREHGLDGHVILFRNVLEQIERFNKSKLELK